LPGTVGAVARVACEPLICEVAGAVPVNIWATGADVETLGVGLELELGVGKTG